MIVSSLFMVASSVSAAPIEIGLAGSGELLWIYQRGPANERGEVLLSFGVLPSERIGFVGPAVMRGLVGRVAAMAATGRDLHVIYDEGSHRRYRFVEHEIRTISELPLPAGMQLLGLAAAEGQEGVWALVIKPVDDHNPATRSDRVVVMRYDKAQWHPVAEGPADYRNDEQWQLAVSSQGTIVVAKRAAGQRTDQLWRYADERWQEMPSMSTVHENEKILALLDTNGQWVAAVGGVAIPDHPLLNIQALQETRFEMTNHIESGPVRNQSIIAASWHGQLAVAGLDDAGHVWWSGWPLVDEDARDGRRQSALAAVDWREVRSLHKRGRAGRSESILNWSALAMLLGLFMLVLRTRQQRITQPVELPRGMAVAKSWRRMMAFMLDGGPVLMLTLPLWWPPLERVAFYEKLLELEGRTMPIMTLDLWQGWLAACGVYVLYGTLFEALVGSTPGKLAVRCRVVDEQGYRCRWGAVIVRNICKAVELAPIFKGWPVVLLILLTRNRQRIGDLLGRTLVVELVELPDETLPAATDSPDSTTGPTPPR
ncbi:MAG: hypothetical protein HJJLKODD_00853 [Phycisphaerae bacterium]|nr:hypothetical protein [Phycisphaerae bacterium]